VAAASAIPSLQESLSFYTPLPFFLLFLAAYAARIIFEMRLYYEIAEIVLIIAVALLILLLSLDRGPASVPMTDRVLVVGAHPDDIELGAAGAMLRFTHEGARVYGMANRTDIV